jgi:endonuclease/exonuclease/phosphatase family metal-dependent hydrolase
MMNAPLQRKQWLPAFFLVGSLSCQCLLYGGLALFGVPWPEALAAILALYLLVGIASLVYTLFAIKTRKWTAIACFVIAVGTFAGVGGYLHVVLSNEDSLIPVHGNAEKPPAPIKRLRLLDLNVLHGYPDFEQQEQRFQETIAVIKTHDPDILVLQEAWNTGVHGNMAERLGEALGFNYCYARANGSRSFIGFEEGAAVFSRLPILEARRVVLKPRQPLWENRIALLTKLDLGNNETLTLAGVHLSVSSSSADQVESLLGILKKQPHDIVAGDFNSEPASQTIHAMLKRGYIEAFPTGSIHGDRHLDESTAEPFIDHVFLAKTFYEHWRIDDATWIITSKVVEKGSSPGRAAVSDHDGILVDLKRWPD